MYEPDELHVRVTGALTDTFVALAAIVVAAGTWTSAVVAANKAVGPEPQVME